MFGSFNKIHNTLIMSCPFLKSSPLRTVKILRVRLSFEVRLVTKVLPITRLCAKDLVALKGVEFNLSYSLVAEKDYILLMTAIAMEEGIIL